MARMCDVGKYSVKYLASIGVKILGRHSPDAAQLADPPLSAAEQLTQTDG